MAQMNISVPDGLKAWAEARVAEGRYSSTSDYIRDLMRRDQEYAEKLAVLQAEIDKGFASPDITIRDIMAEPAAKSWWRRSVSVRLPSPIFGASVISAIRCMARRRRKPISAIWTTR